MRPVTPANNDVRTQVVQYQKGADAVRVRGTFMRQPVQFAMQAPCVFVHGRRFIQYRPDAFARVMAQQHRQQLVAIEAVGLGTTGTPVDFDTCRINHDVVDSLIG